jgi:hypothetical protein
MIPEKSKPCKQRWVLILALLLATVHGLIYIFLVPPWQHYDEPNHFELAWLIAQTGHLPVPGDENQDIRRQIASSMIKHGFFKNMGFLPDLDQKDNLIWIGSYSQLGQPPLYYILAAIPVWLMRSYNVDVQLYAVRFTSLLLFLLTVVVAYSVIAELTSMDNPLRWMVPIAIALLPGFTDTMTSANSDVIAIAVFSLFLWGCIRMIKRGMNIYRLLWVVGASLLCLIAKETSYVAILLLPLALLFAVFRSGPWRWVGWGLCLAAIIMSVVMIFSWGDAALWFRSTNQSVSTRSAYSNAPLGNYVFELQATPVDSKPGVTQLYQLLPNEEVINLRSKTITLGAWIWANKPSQMSAMTLTTSDVNGKEVQQGQQFAIGESPAFYSFSASVPDETGRAWVSLSTASQGAGSAVTIYFDGLIMAEGQFPLGEAPQWESSEGRSGIWAGQGFTNLIRNSSAETAGLRFRFWVDRLGEKILPAWERPSMVLYSLLDRSGAGWYYVVTAQNLLRTFWGKFGWGNVSLIGSKPYRALGFVTMIGAVGTVLVLPKISKKTLWEVLFLLSGATLAVWAFAWMRGSYYLIYRPFIPPARYAYPVIIPTISFLCLGWSLIAQKLSVVMRIPNKLWIGIFGIFFLGLSMISMITIFTYYYR